MHNLHVSNPLVEMYRCLFEMTFANECAKVKRLVRLGRVQFLLFAVKNHEMGMQDVQDAFKTTNFYKTVQVVKDDFKARLLNRDILLSEWGLDIGLLPSTKGLYRLKVLDTYPWLFRDVRRDASQALTPFKMALKSRGFNAYLCQGEDDLQLWSNCEPWMFDVVLRRMTLAEFKKEVDDGHNAMPTWDM